MPHSLILSAGPLQLEFFKHADRYAHKIALSGQGEDVGLLESIEGTSDDAWPPSPPLQDVHIENRAGGVQVALGVGRAGTSHWSFSCEAKPDEQLLEFDIACRIAESAEVLGSAYISHRPALFAEKIEAWSSAELRRRGNRLCVLGNAQQAVKELPATIRWAYSLRFS